jgi:DNA-directed RNA polymerase specialized sigma24 family protein/ribosome-associated translation inhibitor RaiA
MNVRWTYRHCDAQKASARSYWQEKMPRLERILTRFDPDRCRLDMHLYFHRVHKRWELRASLYLPTGLIIANEEGSELHPVLDNGADELVRQIHRHKAKIRKEHLVRRRRRQLDHENAAAVSLESDYNVGRTAAFFELIKPLLTAVQSHAARELRILELEEAIPTGEVTVDDLVDDVLVYAWESYSERPQNTPIDVWLIGILHERLAELQDCYGDTKLSSPVERVSADEGADFDPEDLHYWLSQALLPTEPVTLEDVLAGEESGDWLRRLEVKEQHERVLGYLQRLPKHERQAFMLSVMEGFEIREIAMALDRTEEQVVADIENARTTVRNLVTRDTA